MFTLAAAAWPQSAQHLSPRELFYQPIPEQTRRPTVHKRTSVTNSPTPASRSTPPKEHLPSSTVEELTRTTASVPNLGLRYNVELQNPKSGEFEPESVDREFRTGDRFVLEIEPNYSGYLYVFGRGSSGAWQPLFPYLTPGTSNRVEAHRQVRVPSEDCFELKPPSGVEHIFVVLGRDREDFVALNAAIERGVTPSAPAAVLAPDPTEQIAGVDLSKAVDQLHAQLRGRDIGIKKIEEALSPGEPPHSVYAVNMSPVPGSRVVAELRLKH